LAGSKRSSESPGNCGKDLGICLSVSSASATPASSPSQGGSAATGGNGIDSGGAGGSGSGGASLEGAGGSGAAIASDIRAAGASDLGAAVASDIGATGASDRGFVAAGTSTASAIVVEGMSLCKREMYLVERGTRGAHPMYGSTLPRREWSLRIMARHMFRCGLIAIGPNAITRADVRATTEQLDFGPI